MLYTRWRHFVGVQSETLVWAMAPRVIPEKNKNKNKKSPAAKGPQSLAASACLVYVLAVPA